jgi:hypothetical protein
MTDTTMGLILLGCIVLLVWVVLSIALSKWEERSHERK